MDFAEKNGFYPFARAIVYHSFCACQGESVMFFWIIQKNFSQNCLQSEKYMV